MATIHRKDEPEQPKIAGRDKVEQDGPEQAPEVRPVVEKDTGAREPEPVYYAPIPEQKHADYADREIVEPPEQDNPNVDKSKTDQKSTTETKPVDRA